jgi:hypothetical protein
VLFLGLVGAAIYGALVLSYDVLRGASPIMRRPAS